jgi:signal transduction histidine kinase
MKIALLWKLFGLNIMTIVIVVGIVWGAVDYLAADYFSVLMKRYHISPTESHDMFVASIHRYLIWGSLSGVFLSLLLGYFIMRRMLAPLTQMTRITHRIAAGDFSATIPVSTGDEVGQLARSFNRMSESLDHMEKLRKTMIVDVAHELKTPLTNIRGYIEALMDEMVPHSTETYGLLQSETDRLTRLVSDILQLAKVGGAKLSLDILKLQLPEAIKSAYNSFRLQLAAKDIDVDISSIEPNGWILADPDKLSQILYNLFQNALQYTPKGGQLKIKTEKAEDMLTIYFINTFEGLQKADVPLLFERFYRGEKSRSRDYGGAGIGLAVVQELVSAHNGKAGAFLRNDEIHIWFSLPGNPTL